MGDDGFPVHLRRDPEAAGPERRRLRGEMLSTRATPASSTRRASRCR